jgi:hypothetical protein
MNGATQRTTRRMRRKRKKKKTTWRQQGQLGLKQTKYIYRLIRRGDFWVKEEETSEATFIIPSITCKCVGQVAIL